MRFNDLDLTKWKECNINSLWLIAERDKNEEHKKIFIKAILFLNLGKKC